jgi:DNA-binding transcriptional ArsR family regulator
MQDIAEILKALADPTRRALFEAVANAAGVAVRDLVGNSGVSPPAVSQHLRVLRDAGLVIESREGRQAAYRVTSGGLKGLKNWLAVYDADDGVDAALPRKKRAPRPR